MHIKERLSALWIFALLNYLYADVIALWDIVGSRNPVQLPAGALMASAVLMEIPIAMILASRLLPFRANRSVATSAIIWQAWTWKRDEAAMSLERITP